MKPSLPQGTRDFSKVEIYQRQYIIHIIKSVFEKYQYSPLETPAFEKLNTLLGKYGDEGDKLIFKILNNGMNAQNDDKKAKLETACKNYLNHGINSEEITERALKYDLTIPFARFVTMNRHNISFPYKRYQIQPVWRADRPQKGRYREFYQCDADVIGSNSLVYEGELLCIYDEVFEKLSLPDVKIGISNRKILEALTIKFGISDSFSSFTTSIDKLDKVGWENVSQELQNLGLTSVYLMELENIFIQKKSISEQLEFLKEYIKGIEVGEIGVNEISEVIHNAKLLRNKEFYAELYLDMTLARGLDYYTGMIVEVKTTAVTSGSIGGGGRYDNLTGQFGLPDVSGVGVSFGLDRIYNVLEELQLFPSGIVRNTKILIAYDTMDIPQDQFLPLVSQWRYENLPALFVFDSWKVEKIYKFAEKENIPFVSILSQHNLQNKSASVKNIVNREVREMAFSDFKNINYDQDSF